MSRTKFSLIAAVHNRSRAIAVNGEMPWDRPEDLARFKRLTSGDAVLMGRRTFESLPDPARPLPGRKNVVLSGSEQFMHKFRDTDVVVAASRQVALNSVSDESRVWVIGGETVYRQFAGFCDDMHLTWVWGKEGEDFGVSRAEQVTWFPEIAEELKDHVFQREAYEEVNGCAFEHLVR